MSKHDAPGPEVAREKRGGGEHEQQDHEGVDQGFAQQLDVRMALFPRHDVGAVFLQAPLGLRRRKAILRGVQFLQHLFGFTPGGFEKQR